jgi:hypothetical protein
VFAIRIRLGNGSRVSGRPMQTSVTYVFSPVTPVITQLTEAGVTPNRTQMDIVK